MNTTGPRRDPLAVGVSVLLVVLAFAGSFTHVRDTVAAAGQPGWLAWAIAGMPELTVALAMRKAMTGQRGPAVWVSGGLAGTFTLCANLAGAQPTVWGWLAAGWPAWSAVSALWLAGVHATPPAAVVVRPPARPATAKPVAGQPGLAVAMATGRPMITADAADWDDARAAWEASGRTMSDQAIADRAGASKDAARSRRRGWDGTRR